MSAKPKRGGVRKGAGRKPAPNPKVRISAHIETSQLAYLKTLDSDVAKALRKVITEHKTALQ